MFNYSPHDPAHCSETSQLPQPAPTYEHPPLIKGKLTPTASCCKSFPETKEIKIESEVYEAC